MNPENEPSPCVTVSLDALLHNVAVIRSQLPDSVKIIAVIKDNAYGCGAVTIAKTLFHETDIDFFAVATPHEALFLKSNDIKGTILIFGKATKEQMRHCAQKQCVFTLSDIDDLVQWLQYDFSFSFHIEIDTGMRRMGITTEMVPVLIDLLKDNAGCKPDGIFTHFASADKIPTESITIQHDLFLKVIEQFDQHGIAIPNIHISNSAAIFRFKNYHRCTHVRPGIALYGCQTDPGQQFSGDLEPIVTLRGNVISLRNVPSGTPVSYGGNYITRAATTVATINVGYAHGLPRFLSNKGTVLVRGNRYYIAGNVTMDYCMIDAGPSTSIKVGDEAVFIGKQGNETISPDDIALLGNTIGYEVLCNIGTRIKRQFLYHNSIIE